MTTDEVFEKVLIEKNIFPPSVQDRLYGVNTEMSKVQVIEKTLREVGRHRPWEPERNGSDFIPTVMAELHRRLPDCNIKTCGAFNYLNAACCDPCHAASPHVDMDLIDLPDGSTAWVCENIRWAIFPERYAEYQDWLRNSPLGKLFSKSMGDADQPEG